MKSDDIRVSNRVWFPSREGTGSAAVLAESCRASLVMVILNSIRAAVDHQSRQPKTILEAVETESPAENYMVSIGVTWNYHLQFAIDIRLLQ